MAKFDSILESRLIDPISQVVSTHFTFLDGRELNTHQYSVTQYERDCAPRHRIFALGSALTTCHNPLVSGSRTGKDADGHQTTHG